VFFVTIPPKQSGKSEALLISSTIDVFRTSIRRHKACGPTFRPEGLPRRFYVFRELFKALLCLNGIDARKTMRRNRSSKKRIDTTLGDLIEALSEVAFEQCKDAKEAYTLAGLVLADVLSNCLRSDLTSPIKDPPYGFLEYVYNKRYFN